METPLLKPRWMTWESVCLKVAFEQKIQLKIIAAALEKSVTSVSKKIRKLGLREERTRPGRLKGHSYDANGGEKISRDLAKMTEIIKTYTPFAYSQKVQICLQSGQQIGKKPLSQNLKKGASIAGIAGIKQKDASYSFPSPLNYTLLDREGFQSHDVIKVPGEPLYISLCHIENWAMSKGFRQVKKPLWEQGVSYWKGGKYFSKAQVLVHINGIRLENKLKPLHLYEEEMEC